MIGGPWSNCGLLSPDCQASGRCKGHSKATQDEDELREKLKDITSVRHLHNQDMFNNPSCSGLNPAGIDALVRLISYREQSIKEQAEIEARKDQTFKVVQSLVKAGSISDYAAAHTLAMHNTLLGVPSTNNSLEEK